ncbi:hypothetical protein [Streptomyces kronopolitis]
MKTTIEAGVTAKYGESTATSTTEATEQPRACEVLSSSGGAQVTQR